jgi:hypothetical protein
MSTVPYLLQAVKEVFVEGRSRPPYETEASSGRRFGELFRASLWRRLKPAELSFFDFCASRHCEVLQSARRDQLGQARHSFDDVWERFRSEHLSSEGRLLVQTFLEPAETYLHYKLKEYRRAREFVLHTSALDQTLVTDFGFSPMSARRLQLGHNLLRIHARLGERRDVVHLAGAFLDYLELRVESLPEPLACPRAFLACVPETILDYYFDKFCGVLALVLAGSTDESTAALFRPLAHHAGPNGCQGDGFGAHGHAWLYGKQLAMRGEIEAFLVRATDLLQVGKMSEPTLWFATIIEVVGFYRSLGPEGSRLADWIADDASMLVDAPWALRQVICTE